MHNLAFSYAYLGRHADALKLQEESLALGKAHLREGHPHTVACMDAIAWLLATCPDLKLRDPARAVKLATESVELAEKPGTYWNTLGTAQYRMGDWRAAIDALKKSMELRDGGDGADWFFLAMAYWQLGQKEEARAWYDRAVSWMAKNKSKDEEIRRFPRRSRGPAGCQPVSRKLLIPKTICRSLGDEDGPRHVIDGQNCTDEPIAVGKSGPADTHPISTERAKRTPEAPQRLVADGLERSLHPFTDG